MNIINRSVSRDYLRNGKLNIKGGSSSYQGVSSYGSISGNYLPATFNADGTYTVDLSKVTFTGNIIAEGEVTAYGSGDSGGSSGNVAIYDGLDSTASDVALSANQGRILKSLIDNIDVGGITVDLTDYYKKTEVDTLLAGYSKTDHTHKFSEIKEKPTTLSGYGITDAALKNHTHSSIGSFTTFNITKSDNSGFPTWMLIADITARSPLATKEVISFIIKKIKY